MVASGVNCKHSTKKAEWVESGWKGTFEGQSLAAFREGQTWGGGVSLG